MASAEWPAGLPQFVLQDGFQETLPKAGMETTMEAGPAKTRRRFTTNWRQFTMSIKMEIEQQAIFDDFYINTLAMGTLPFDWISPRTRLACTFRFHPGTPPAYAMAGGTAVIVSFPIEQML